MYTYKILVCSKIDIRTWIQNITCRSFFLRIKKNTRNCLNLSCSLIYISYLNALSTFFAGELDDKMKWLKNFDRLLEIQRNIVWPSVLEMDSKQYFPEFLKSALSKQPCERLIVSPRRQILIEGQLLLLDYGKPSDMHVILFDDLLLITRRKKSISKKVKSNF